MSGQISVRDTPCRLSLLIQTKDNTLIYVIGKFFALKIDMPYRMSQIQFRLLISVETVIRRG